MAGDLILGLGSDNIDTDSVPKATALHLEYHSDALLSFDWGGISALGLVEVDEHDDVYAGLGVAALWNATDRWFVEASLAAGHYEKGSDGLDLGGSLQFRTLIGVGYRISDATRLSISIDHLSNAGLEDVNPGRNAVFLRVARSF